MPPRSHDHDAGGGAGEAAGHVTGVDAHATNLTGRTRGNKLVHLAGDTGLVGTLVPVRIEHAGPYALRGVVAEAAGVGVVRGAAAVAATGTGATTIRGAATTA